MGDWVIERVEITQSPDHRITANPATFVRIR